MGKKRLAFIKKLFNTSEEEHLPTSTSPPKVDEPIIEAAPRAQPQIQRNTTRFIPPGVRK